MDYLGYNADFNHTDTGLLLGEIPEIFSAPLIPKIVIVGLNLNEDPSLQLLKDGLLKVLNNLFVVEFAEQFFPPSDKLPSNQSYYRTHEVKESWMYKMRFERPAILIDFRLLSIYPPEDDLSLADHIYQTKNYLPADGPIYMLWLAGRDISSNRLSSLAKALKIDKSSIQVLEIWDDFTLLKSSLKPKIQDCFEVCRKFYSNLSKKYKVLVAKSDQTKFVAPWMPTVYYYFKLAILEEFRGDFQSALKYYHTILAKFKELIEGSNEKVHDRYQIINNMRRFADICFIRLSFLLFRLDQSAEAEFGLFRYLNYFRHGLSDETDEALWKSNMSRSFARQSIQSSLWSSQQDSMMRGSAHFLIYSLTKARTYLKIGLKESDITYKVNNLVLKDLSEALDLSLKQTKLAHFVDYLQILVLDQYLAQGLAEQSRPFLDYLKSSPILRGWSKIMNSLVLGNSVRNLKLSQEYEQAALDLWNQGSISDASELEDLCILQSQTNQESIRFTFPPNYQYVKCSVGFLTPHCEIHDKCQIQLVIYNSSNSTELFPESIGIFFDNEQVDPLTIICGPEDVFAPRNVYVYRAVFTPNQIGSGKLKISYVTMQMKKPFLALQFDDSSFVHMQNSHRFKCESFDFMRKCQKLLRSQLILKIEPMKPNIKVDFIFKDKSVLAGSEIEVIVKVSNLSSHPTAIFFNHRGESYNILLSGNDSKCLTLKFVADFVQNLKMCLKISAKFNIDSMDFKNTEICSFEPIEEEFSSNFHIKILNPFCISFSRKKQRIRIQAFSNIEFIQLPGHEGATVRICDNETREFEISSDLDSFKAGFRIEGCNEDFYWNVWTF